LAADAPAAATNKPAAAADETVVLDGNSLWRHFLVSRCAFARGDDGKLAGKVEASKHPGYAKSVLSYDKSTDTWTEAEEGSANVLSTACTKWSGGYALTNGELRPFVRSAEGWLLRPE
jgi:hypothetical protein